MNTIENDLLFNLIYNWFEGHLEIRQLQIKIIRKSKRLALVRILIAKVRDVESLYVNAHI